MVADTQHGGVSELRRWSRGMALTAPCSAAVLRGLADAADDDDASLNALLGPGWLGRPLAGVRLLAGVHDLVLAGKAAELKALGYLPDPDPAPAGGQVLCKAARRAIFD